MFRKNNLSKKQLELLRFQAKFCSNKNEAKKANSEIVKYEQSLLNLLLNFVSMFAALLLALVVFNSMYWFDLDLTTNIIFKLLLITI